MRNLILRLILQLVLGLPLGTSVLAQTQVAPSMQRATEKSVSKSHLKPKKQEEPVALPDRTYNGELFFNLQGNRFKDAVVNSQYSRLFIGLSLEAIYHDWFLAKLAVVQMLTSGQASNLYSAPEGGTGSGTLFEEASLSVLPFQGGKVSAGVLNLPLNPIYSQMMDQSNAGALVAYDYQGERASAGIEASQSIPTSKANSIRTVDQDVLPLQTMGNLHLGFEAKPAGFKAKVAVARFTFTDLSSQSAADSQKIGSTVMGNGRGGFLFAYEFRGTEYAAQLEQQLFLLDKIQLQGSTVVNELAPQGKNSGWQGRVEYTRGFNKWNLIPSFVRFRMESDALPAAYSLFQFGFTNRDGVAYGLKIDFPKEKFRVFGGYSNSKVIDTNSTAGVFQADREIFVLGAEAKYDLF